MHWPWETDDVLLASVQALTKKVDALSAVVKTQHNEEIRIMSKLSDAIAALGASVDAALARVDEDVQALTAKIAELQALVDAGGATPEDFAALAEAQAKLDALDPTKPDVLPE